MRTFLLIITGLVGGFILGNVLSEIIGIFGVVVFHIEIGIKFLSIFTALICAIVIPTIDSIKRNKKGEIKCF